MYRPTPGAAPPPTPEPDPENPYEEHLPDGVPLKMTETDCDWESRGYVYSPDGSFDLSQLDGIDWDHYNWRTNPLGLRRVGWWYGYFPSGEVQTEILYDIDGLPIFHRIYEFGIYGGYADYSDPTDYHISDERIVTRREGEYTYLTRTTYDWRTYGSARKYVKECKQLTHLTGGANQLSGLACGQYLEFDLSNGGRLRTIGQSVYEEYNSTGIPTGTWTTYNTDPAAGGGHFTGWPVSVTEYDSPGRIAHFKGWSIKGSLYQGYRVKLPVTGLYHGDAVYSDGCYYLQREQDYQDGELVRDIEWTADISIDTEYQPDAHGNYELIVTRGYFYWSAYDKISKDWISEEHRETDLQLISKYFFWSPPQ